VSEHVFVSRTRFHPEDLAFLSGFVAGDGSFIIHANNAGTSWCCALDITLRADDTPLLAYLRDWSGIGELVHAAARGRSHPQTSWKVTRRADCVELVRILSQCPPIGKGAAQFDLWCRAVEAWVAEGGASPALSALAARMRELHRSVVPVPCPVDITERELMPFLAGFASAEAHFGASDQGSPAFVINLRADDGPLLGLFHRTFGIGHLRDIAPAGSSRAAVSWRVGRLSDLRRLVELFEAHRPRGRAGYVYTVWRELVRLELRTSTIRRALAIEVRRRRRFVAGRDRIERVSVADRRRKRCEQALRRWARSDDYPGSVLDYERWRRSSGRGAPSRSTIAAAFGSWLAALEALGLQTAASHSRERVAALKSGSARHHAARRARSRTAILAAVRRCIEEIGHEPAATEFLRWRAERAPESPCQMTIYRLFPGGFAEVLAAASS
jgi:hypothetical protein